ncbi:MAG: tetratricopeptide repeat protein [Polyangiaceae bacterium]
MGEWAYVKLEEKVAKRNGMPMQIPVPKEEFEGLADTGLDGAKVRTWIGKFMQEVSGSWRQQNNELASRYDAFLAKGMHWDKAQKAFQKGDSEAAIKALKMITRVDKEDGAAKLNLAMALAASGQYPEALEAFKSIEEVGKGDPDYHVARANVHMALQETDDAINHFADALEAKPDCKPAMDGLVTAGVLTRVYEDPKDAASLTYVRRDSVLDYFEDLWGATDRSVEYYLEQIAYHEMDGRSDVVIGAADRALKLDDSQDRAAAARVAALRALKRDDAADEAKKYLESHPDSVAMLVELAQCVGAYSDEGKGLLDRALEKDPGDQIALTLRYWPSTGEELQPLLAALPDLKAFAESHAECAGAWRSVGRAMLRLGKDDEALEIFRKAIALAPQDDDLRSEFWSELGRLQKWDEILKDAESVENITKRSWQLRWGEAEAYAGSGKKMEARAAFGAIAGDESLLIDLRRRAKRAAERAMGGE